MIKYAIKTGNRYLTADYGYTKNINKAVLWDIIPPSAGNERVVKIEIIRKEIE